MVKKSGMDGERFCGVIINDGKCGAADDYVNSWTIDVPPKPKDLPQAPAPSAEVLIILCSFIYYCIHHSMPTF